MEFSYEELKEVSRCALFVNQLPQVHQESIKNRLTDGLMSEGYNVFQIDEILADAMKDKVDSVMDVIWSMENEVAPPLPLCGTCNCEDGQCVYSLDAVIACAMQEEDDAMKFNEILRFMQDEDRNGDWLTADESEAEYLLNTIRAWKKENGLVITPRVQLYIDHLKEIVAETNQNEIDLGNGADKNYEY